MATTSESASSISAEAAASIFETPVNTLSGAPSSIGAHRGKALLVVNVASRCGLTPQYEALEKLQKEYGERGFSVLGFPCNQFGGQEPGSAEEIREFCSLTYGVTFPMFEKIEVNGPERHPIYTALTEVPDPDGHVGDIRWNFEKFVISADGRTITRFAPQTKPYDAAVIAAIEAGLPAR
ncbi:glutathione peroxidase [Haliangium ochraceum]|uniref:Glutathione peroxidase n=1 Tax=Haliangium ochraceum (strain DSM 14365 / JCM 11303 / SMP-2) TaxID=502025 RepID=D0LYK0_HALO1|nr:glutathione peroxidase [Haliangium ochraceum]ACY17866.1 Peroxiredoxin [Haliangium ochraceum DSM 14365]